MRPRRVGAAISKADPKPGNTLIKQANPEMTDALLDYGREALRSHGIVESGDGQTLGIGAMTDDRWRDFFGSMVQAGCIRRNSTTNAPTPCNLSTRRRRFCRRAGL